MPRQSQISTGAVLLLKAPTQLKEVTAEFQAACTHPACGLQVALDIRGIMQALQRAGSATRPSKTFDFSGKLVDLTNQKGMSKTRRPAKSRMRRSWTAVAAELL